MMLDEGRGRGRDGFPNRPSTEEVVRHGRNVRGGDGRPQETPLRGRLVERSHVTGDDEGRHFVETVR